jgi:hypothetical protein
VVELRINRSLEDHLRFRDDENGLGLRHGGLLAVRAPRAAASPRIFDWIFCRVPIHENEKHRTSDIHGLEGGKGILMGKPEGKTALRAWT